MARSTFFPTSLNRDMSALHKKRRRVLASLRGPRSVSAESSFLSEEDKKNLSLLGWPDDFISKMGPEEARDILKSDFTFENKKKSDDKREYLLDKHDAAVQKELDKAKKRLDLLNKKQKATQEFIDSLYDRIESMEEENDGSDISHRRIEHFEDLREETERNLTLIEDQIRAQNKMISSIVSHEDALLEELQEINETATLTSGPEDDELLLERINERTKIIRDIGSLRKELAEKDRKLQNYLNQLSRIRRDQEKSLLGGRLRSFNELDMKSDSLNVEVFILNKQMKTLVRKILKKENTLKSKKVEESLREIEEVYDMPSFEDVSKDSEDLIEKDEKTDIRSKSDNIKEKSKDMQLFLQGAEPALRGFVTDFIAPDIPVDKSVDKAIRIASEGIAKRADSMRSLADKYSRNDMHRTSIILVPFLYEIIAKSMLAAVSSQSKEASYIYIDLLEAGHIKEALSFKEIMDKSRQVGNSIKNFAKDTHDTARKVWDKGKDIYDRASDLVDKQKFKTEDKGPRRDFGKPLEDARKHLQHLSRVELDLRQQLDRADSLLEEAKRGNDPNEVARIERAMQEMQQQADLIGKQRDVIRDGLEALPSGGAMAGQEQASRPNKSDYEQAVRLMEDLKPRLLSHLALIPDDADLERELLRHSDRIAKLANKLIQTSYKAKNKSPSLPLTIQAFGYLFLSIDDTLDLALRSNEGISSLSSGKS